MPNADLLVLLRNPVDRAFSHYKRLHLLSEVRQSRGQKAVETASSFEEDIQTELERFTVEAKVVRDGFCDPHSFALNYLYSHDHKEMPCGHFRGCDYYPYLALGMYVDQLKVWMDVFSRDQFLILRSEDLYRDPAEVYQQTLDFLRLPAWEPNEFLTHNQAPTSGIDPARRDALVDLFAPHNERLYEYLGRDFGWK